MNTPTIAAIIISILALTTTEMMLYVASLDLPLLTTEIVMAVCCVLLLAVTTIATTFVAITTVEAPAQAPQIHDAHIHAAYAANMNYADMCTSATITSKIKYLSIAACCASNPMELRTALQRKIATIQMMRRIMHRDPIMRTYSAQLAALTSEQRRTQLALNLITE